MSAETVDMDIEQYIFLLNVYAHFELDLHNII